MGPRLFGRGNLSEQREETGRSKASMGPRLFGRGNVLFVTSGEHGSSKLQWGHVYSDVETPYIKRGGVGEL